MDAYAFFDCCGFVVLRGIFLVEYCYGKHPCLNFQYWHVKIEQFFIIKIVDSHSSGHYDQSQWKAFTLLR